MNSINRERPLLDFSRPADHKTVCEWIDIMDERYDFLKVSSLGESILGRKIHMLTLGNEKAEKSVLFVGTHHGCEWITTLVLLKFVNDLCEYYRSGKQPFGINLQGLFSSRCLRIVPKLNPDGAEIHINGVSKDCLLYDRIEKMSGGDYSLWKSNARGVDLNHNYDAGFEEYKLLERKEGITEGPTRYSGNYPFSEPETSSLVNFIRYDGRIKMSLSLHTSGEEIYYTSDGYAPKGAKSIGDKLAALSGYRLSKPNGLAAYGGLTDWFIKEFDLPAFTIECGRDKTPICERKYFEIYAAIREMLIYAPLMI